jgi:hypothetical protein
MEADAGAVPSGQERRIRTRAQPGARFDGLRRLEHGYGGTFQGILYVGVLWWCFGLVYDLGNAAYVAARLRSATIAAAQDGAKHIDRDAFYRGDGVQLNYDGARQRARAVLAQHMGPIAVSAAVSVQSGVLRDFVVVDARSVVRMRVLHVFGLREIPVSARAAAEAVHGIDDEYQ